METAPAHESVVDEPEAPLSPVQEAAMGTDLEAYRSAKKIEAAAPAVAEPAAEAQPAKPTGVSKRQEKINEYERSIAELKAENARLKAPQPARVDPAPPAARIAEPPTLKDHQRYLAMPDAPKEADFTDYKDYTAAVSIFVHDKRSEERDQARSRDQQAASFREREAQRAQRIHEAFKADAGLNDVFAVIRATGQVPEGSPISRDVLALRPFSALKQGEVATAYTAIAEELLESANPVALAKHLSKPGELARLAALPDARSLIREMARIEDAVKAPAANLETQAGKPATVLTSARATDPLDPVEAALRANDMTAYKAARTEQRLRAAGLRR